MSSPASVLEKPPPAIPDHELLGLIGRGSYGEVWLARNIMGTARAVKIVYRATFEWDKPFEREFAGIQKFEPISRSHEGLVQVLHVGRCASPNCFYYVMELADDAEGRRDGVLERGSDGEKPGTQDSTTPPLHHSVSYVPRTLRSEITRHGRIPLDALLPLSLSLASALGHLHRQGLTHRDLKPSNIIFVHDRPKIADIGLVSELGESHSFVGTEGFVPPEGPGAARADLYSLGKVLYEASTGKDRLRFPEIPTEWLEPPVAKRLLEFHEVVLKACEGRADKRYASAEDLQADLALLQSGKSVRHLHQMERRVAFLSRVGLVAGGAAILALAAYLFAAREARRDREHLQQVAQAEQAARRALQESLLMQARAGRRTGLSGCRFDSLEALRRAAVGTNSLELRNEAIACLALADLRHMASVPVELGGGRGAGLDAALQHHGIIDASGAYHFRRLSDGQERAVFRFADARADHRLPGATNSVRLPAGFRANLLGFWGFVRGTPVTLSSSNAPPHLNLNLSPDGGCLALTTPGGQVNLYDMTDGELLRTLELDGDRRPPPTFSPDSRLVAVWPRRANEVRILNRDSGRRISTLPHPATVTAFRWRRDNRTLATTCQDLAVRLWDTETGQLRHTLAGHQALVNDVVFHPTGEFLATASWDGTIRLWDAATGLPLMTLPASGTSLRFSLDGRRMGFVAWDDQRVLIYEVAESRICRFLQEPIPSGSLEAQKGPRQVEFSPDERLIVAATYDGVRFWDLVGSVEAGHLPLGYCWSAFFEPRGGNLVVCSQDGGVQNWPVRRQPNADEWHCGPPSVVGGEKGGYGRGCMSHGEETLAYLRRSRITVRNQGDTARVLPASFSTESSIALSPDGRWLAVGAQHDKQVHLWDLTARRQVWQAKVGPHAFVTFSPDNRWLVSNSGEETSFWDVPTGRPLRRFPRPLAGDVAGPVVFSPEGRVLARTLTPTVVQLLNAATGQALGAIESPAPRLVSWIGFSPSGTQLAIASQAHIIELWDLRKLRQQLAELGLDWNQPPYPPAPTNAPAGPIRIRVQR